MASIFNLNGCSFVADVGWRVVDRSANNLRIGRVCVAEIERRRAFIEDVTMNEAPILADYIGKIVAESRRALVILRNDEKDSYFIGDFVNGIVNINTDLIVAKENVESVIEAKISEMGYSSPDIFKQGKVKLKILEGFSVKDIKFDNDLIEGASRVHLVGIPLILVGCALAIVLSVVATFTFLFALTERETIAPPIVSPNVLRKVEDTYALDWSSFYEGCTRGLQQSFPRIAGWAPANSGCFAHSMRTDGIGAKIETEPGQGVAWVSLGLGGGHNRLLATSLLQKAAMDFGFFSIVPEGSSQAYVYWRFPVVYEPFSQKDADALDDVVIRDFALSKFGFELLNYSEDNVKGKKTGQAVLELPMNELFARLSKGDGSVELESFVRRTGGGILDVSFVRKKIRRTISRTVRIEKNP